MALRDLPAVLADAVRRWTRANAPELSAVIAFHALLSMAPLLVLVLGATGRWLGRAAARERLFEAVETFAGAAAVGPVRSVTESVVAARGGLLATALGVATLVLFSSAVFREIRAALNRIWEVSGGGLRGVLREQLVSILYVPVAVVAGMLVMALTLLLAVGRAMVADRIPTGHPLWGSLHATLPFVALAALLVVLYRQGPRTDVPWRAAWAGALFAAALFSAGNAVIGWALGRSLLASLYGAAGALVIVLLWSYYSAQILLFGACVSRAWAVRFPEAAAPAAPGGAPAGGG